MHEDRDQDRAGPHQLGVSALLFGIAGIALVLAPRATSSVVGSTVAGDATLLARALGAALLGMGVAAGAARRASRDGRRAVHQGLAAFSLVASILLLMALLAAAVSLWGWVLLAVLIPLFAVHAGSGLGSPPRPRG